VCGNGLCDLFLQWGALECSSFFSVRFATAWMSLVFSACSKRSKPAVYENHQICCPDCFDSRYLADLARKTDINEFIPVIGCLQNFLSFLPSQTWDCWFLYMN